MQGIRRAVAAVALAAVATGAGATAARAAVPATFWGVNVNYVQGTPGELAHFHAMKAAGVDWIRPGAHWSTIETSAPVGGAHTYNWGAWESTLRNATRAGLEVRPVLGFSPYWATSVPGSRFAKPKSTEDFADFVQAFQQRYGPYGSFWQSRPKGRERGANPVLLAEIWNEQNTAAFWNPPDPAAYAHLLGAAVAATRAGAARQDARIGLIVGGLVPGAATATKHEAGQFLAGMAAAVPSLTTDVARIGVHAYVNSTYDAMNVIADVRAKADAAGFTQPLELNENGWSTVPESPGYFLTPVTEEVRAAKLENMVGRVALNREALRLSSYAIYTWSSHMEDRTDGEQWFGVADLMTAALLPSGQAWSNALETHDTAP